MENRKGGASSKCFTLGRINQPCRSATSIYSTGLRAPSPPSCGDAGTREDLSFHRSHVKLYWLPPRGPCKGHVAADYPELSVIYSKEGASPQKASRPWGFATCRTLHEASTIFQEYQKSGAVWIFRKWRIASSLSLSEQTKAGSNHWQNI